MKFTDLSFFLLYFFVSSIFNIAYSAESSIVISSQSFPVKLFCFPSGGYVSPSTYGGENITFSTKWDNCYKVKIGIKPWGGDKDEEIVFESEPESEGLFNWTPRTPKETSYDFFHRAFDKNNNEIKTLTSQLRLICYHERELILNEVLETNGEGELWKLCPLCRRWIKLININVLNEEYIDNRNDTYLICHGNANSVSEDWIYNMGTAILNRFENGVNVIAVDWGKLANPTSIIAEDQIKPWLSAGNISNVVDTVIKQCEAVGLNAAKTTLIGHSHGGHVVANLAIDWKHGKFKRLIGLDTSTTDKWVHKLNKRDPEIWIRKIQKVCKQVEFYKSSWELSLTQNEQLFANYNFFISCNSQLPHLKWLNFFPLPFEPLTESGISRHSFVHSWFTNTIILPENYKNLGFNFKGDFSWNELSNHKIPSDETKGMLCGVINLNRVELLHQNYNYKSWILAPSSKKSPVTRLWERVYSAIEYESENPEIPNGIVTSGNSIVIKTKNNADNFSVPYYLWQDYLTIASAEIPLPVTGAWLVDLQLLLERSATARYSLGVAFNWEDVSLETLSKCIGEAGGARQVSRKLAESPLDFNFAKPGESKDVTLPIKFENNLFDKTRPLMIAKKNSLPTFRKVLLVTATGVESGDFPRAC